ncbi:hypothetical protein RKD37_005980 [Streptomyces ambofaciens]
MRVMNEVTGRVVAPVTQRQAHRVRRSGRAFQAGSGAEASAWAANLAFASSIFRP